MDRTVSCHGGSLRGGGAPATSPQTHTTVDYVLIRSYGSDLEAELARAVLETNGIPAVVRRADAAGILRAVQPADLLVPESDAEEADALLDSAPDTGE